MDPHLSGPVGIQDHTVGGGGDDPLPGSPFVNSLRRCLGYVDSFHVPVGPTCVDVLEDPLMDSVSALVCKDSG